jgi:N6-adenosine-specific RNA methylase IME4
VSLYKTILADPPWGMVLAGKRKRAKGTVGPESLPYATMSLQAICDLPVGGMADGDCHLWLWTTNSHLRAGFQVMEAWGFKYLAPVHWIKPSGVGNWFIHRTQTLLFGYRKSCRFPLGRYKPNVFSSGDPKRHSQKPEESYQLIESISPPSRLELFARVKRPGWDSWGNEVPSDVGLTPNLRYDQVYLDGVAWLSTL